MLVKECGVSRRVGGPLAGGGTPATRFPAPESSSRRRSRSRVAARYGRYRERLQGIGKIAPDLYGRGGEYAYQEARVSSTLKVWGVPEGQGGQRPPLGLSSLPNSQEPIDTGVSHIEEGANPSLGGKRPRKGLNGLTSQGKRNIDEFLTLTEEIKKRLAVWSVNLPDEDYADLKDSGEWPLFQRRLLDHLNQYLRSHGNECLTLSVVELGPGRSSRVGRPVPHLHVVVSGWGVKVPGGGYLLRAEVMDGLVQKACDSVGLPSRFRGAASNIAGVKLSVRSYLKGYLKKSVPVDDIDGSDGWDSLIPRHWWGRSSEAKAYVEGVTFRLPPAFVAYVIQQRKELEQLRLGSHRTVVVAHTTYLGADRPIEIECFRFFSPEHLARAIELFLVWVYSKEAFLEEVSLCPDQGELASHNPDVTSPPLPSLIC